MTYFCPECQLVIAPRDPEARPFHGVMIHGDCIPKYKLRLEVQLRNAQNFRPSVKEARHT